MNQPGTGNTRDMAVDEGRRVTIDTIAREAGVSVSAVSQVLDECSDLPAEARERVRALLTRYGYVPHPVSEGRPRVGGADRPPRRVPGERRTGGAR